MSLELPADLTPYTNGLEDAHQPGAYCLILKRPSSLADRWDQHYEERPPYWSELVNAETVAYVGGTSDLLSRLEDHRDGEVRQTALTKVCKIRGLHTAWPVESEGEAWRTERKLARLLQQVEPSWFIHQR